MVGKTLDVPLKIPKDAEEVPTEYSLGDLTREAISNTKLFEESIAEAINLLRLDTTDPELADTPRRIREFWQEYCQPFDPGELFARTSIAKDSNMVVLGPLEFRMLCCHHFAPVVGHAWVGYVPHKKLLGLSKFPRLVLGVALQKPSLQEYLNDEIAKLIDEYLEPKGVIVVVKAQHSCMTSRGIAQPGGYTATSSVRGVFRDVAEAREEFFHLTNMKGI